MKDIIVIAHNIRSTHNVGSLLRTCEGLGIKRLILSGYTPYPLQEKDPRLPHLSLKIDSQIHKTALGAEKLVNITVCEKLEPILGELKSQGYLVVALEQTSKSIDLKDFVATPKIALILGREVEGVEPEILALCDRVIEIPMRGKKESFNVVQAAAMALYTLT